MSKKTKTEELIAGISKNTWLKIFKLSSDFKLFIKKQGKDENSGEYIISVNGVRQKGFLKFLPEQPLIKYVVQTAMINWNKKNSDKLINFVADGKNFSISVDNTEIKTAVNTYLKTTNLDDITVSILYALNEILKCTV